MCREGVPVCLNGVDYCRDPCDQFENIILNGGSSGQGKKGGGNGTGTLPVPIASHAESPKLNSRPDQL